uniref:C2 domain-containing protein n=1 Tax=Branchiostoma floridae TaxID=7739 RepID=C3ZQW4_BRAFL|eukprot:XP_002588994.1 hypothetical protein BRAFLDRAFT_87463 [Branchiostoma floridae]
MGVIDKAASAFLSVVHVLSLLRPGGKRQSGETKLGCQSQGKYLVTMRHGKVKIQTAKKKSDALIWEHSTEFVPWSPTDRLVLKLRKAKRCKDTTVGELSIDVAAALESADGLPQKWWYIMDRPSKGGRRNEEVFLQVSVTLDGTEVKRQPTQNQVPANPPEGTVEASGQGNPESPSELQNHQGKAVAVSQENEADTPNDNNAKDSKPPSVAGQDSATASTSDTANKFAVNEDGDVDTCSSSRNTDVTPLQVSGAADGPDPERKSELPNDAADEFAVNEDRDVNKDELPKGQGKSRTQHRTTAATSSASGLPVTAPDTADKRPAAGEGDVPECHPSVVRGEEMEASDNSGAGIDSQTTTSAEGGVSLTTTTPSPKHKDTEGPQYEVAMSSVDKLWAELHLERDYAEKLLAHADSLRSRLATTVPHVLRS